MESKDREMIAYVVGKLSASSHNCIHCGALYFLYPKLVIKDILNELTKLIQAEMKFDFEA